MPKTNTPFWIVWCPERGLPQLRHSAADSAIVEARRVATRENVEVHVCKCIGTAKPMPASFTFTERLPVSEILARARDLGGTGDAE